MASESSSSEKLSGVKHPSDSYGGRPAGDAVVLTVGDVEMLVGLEQEYSNTVNESEIDIQARIIWARHSALISIVFMILYLVVGIAFFRTQTDWDLPNATLFAVYTATSAGYGHLDIPKTPLFQIFDIFYIIIGIAGLAICVAQSFQFISLQASQSAKSRDKAEVARQGLEQLAREPSTQKNARAKQVLEHKQENYVQQWKDRFFQVVQRVKTFFRNTAAGRCLAIALPLLAILLVGAIAIGPIEGWTFIESVYFAVVSMTTEGYGAFESSMLVTSCGCYTHRILVCR